jgi:transposase
MKSLTFIGVDVCQATLDIAVDGCAQVVKIANTLVAIRAWLKTLPERCHIAVESTAKLHLPLVRAALAAGHILYVLNPRDLAHYAASLGRRAKTDRLDALLIARYLQHEHAQLHPYRLPSRLQTQLDELIKRRHTLVAGRQAQRQSLQTLTCELRSGASLLRTFQRVIDEIDTRLQQLVAQDPALADTTRRLRTIVGFGPLLSASMAHMITRLPFRNADAFIAYIGYDPRARDSGKLRGRRYLSKRGPAEMRRLLFNAAMSAAHSKLWRPHYQRYLQRGFSTTAALVILARKLARIAFSLARLGGTFQPERLKMTCNQP